MFILVLLLTVHFGVNLVVMPIAIIAEQSKRCTEEDKAVRVRGAMLEVYCDEQD